MYEMEWIVDIYNFFFVKLAVGWSNSCYKLILTVGSKFGSNLAIRSSYNRWKHFVVVDQVKIEFPLLDHKSDHWMPLQKHKWNLSHQNVKNSNWYIDDFFHFSLLFRASLHSWFNRRFIGSKPIFQWYLWHFSKFLPFNHRCSKSFRDRPISNILMKYHR